MDINDIYKCAKYYKDNYLDTYYIIVTYNGRSFILIGEQRNFPHLMGIDRNTYRSNGYRNPASLYNDILNNQSINPKIIPKRISPGSKMYKKVLNFQHSADVFLKNKGPLAIRYNHSNSTSKLSNVDILITDISSGYMLGWVLNTTVQINSQISINKHCISTWIDESNNVNKREKYMPNQDVELLRHVLIFDNNSDLIKNKEYKYSETEKIDILNACSRNHSNLIINNHNKRFYEELAISNGIKCKINGVQF